jgi:hypothetical protein
VLGLDKVTFGEPHSKLKLAEHVLWILELQVGKRIYQDWRVAKSKGLIRHHLKGKKMVGSYAKEHNAPPLP